VDQPRSTLFDATAAVFFPGVVGSLELFPFPNESLEIRSGENPPRTTSWARFLLLDADSFKSVRLPCFLLLHTVASLLLFQGPPPPARSMAASAVIALTAFSTLGAATLASPYSYGRFPCSVWGSDNRLHGGEPFRQVSHRLVSSLARARKALHVPPRPTETLAGTDRADTILSHTQTTRSARTASSSRRARRSLPPTGTSPSSATVRYRQAPPARRTTRLGAGGAVSRVRPAPATRPATTDAASPDNGERRPTRSLKS
jgi:hypothetical protein